MVASKSSDSLLSSIADDAKPLSFWKALNHPEAKQLLGESDLSRLTLSAVAWLKAQGLAPYVYSRLSELQLLNRVAEETKTALRECYYKSAVAEALQHQEAITLVLSTLSQVGVETVLMKGIALAHTVYPNPRSRVKGDLDIWLRPDQVPVAIEALRQVGYRTIDREERPLALRLQYGGEQKIVTDRPGFGLVELHWPAIHGEWLRHIARVDHAGIWARRLPIEIDGQRSTVMAPEDLLIHLCIHEGINHQFGAPWIRSLLDIHLVVQHYRLDWAEIVTRARHWRVATVVWAMLSLAEQLCGTAIPASVMSTLAPTHLKQQMIDSLHLSRVMVEREAIGYTHRRLLIQLVMVDRVQDLARLIWYSLFPEAKWLQVRYDAPPGTALWRIRVSHLLHFLQSSRA